MDAAEDKISFCKRFVRDEMQCSIVRKLAFEQLKMQQQRLKEIGEYEDKIQSQEIIIQKLRVQLEMEHEWCEYGNLSKMDDNDYKSLRDFGKHLSEVEARNLLSEWYGFNSKKLNILSQLESYQITRHKQLRVIGQSFRPPVYASSDWNYIRFDCSLGSYELVNGELRIF